MSVLQQLQDLEQQVRFEIFLLFKNLQVMAVAWLIASVFFVASFVSPCRGLPSQRALGYYEAESELDDFYAGGALTDRRGLKHFPRLWCAEGEFSSFGQLFFTPIVQQVVAELFMQLSLKEPIGQT